MATSEQSKLCRNRSPNKHQIRDRRTHHGEHQVSGTQTHVLHHQAKLHGNLQRSETTRQARSAQESTSGTLGSSRHQTAARRPTPSPRREDLAKPRTPTTPSAKRENVVKRTATIPPGRRGTLAKPRTPATPPMTGSSECGCSCDVEKFPDASTWLATLPEERLETEMAWRQRLGDEQFRVMRMKGTEEIHTGEYENFFGEGSYCCGACAHPLYHSSHKFRSGHGWPAFADSLSGALQRHGQRKVEITCASCDGHIGHVFKSARYPKPHHERHCVNSVSLRFVPAGGQCEESELTASTSDPREVSSETTWSASTNDRERLDAAPSITT